MQFVNYFYNLHNKDGSLSYAGEHHKLFKIATPITSRAGGSRGPARNDNVIIPRHYVPGIVRLTLLPIKSGLDWLTNFFQAFLNSQYARATANRVAGIRHGTYNPGSLRLQCFDCVGKPPGKMWRQ